MHLLSRRRPVTPPHRMASASLAGDPGAAAGTCVSCGRPAGTPFCPHCGEQRPSDRHGTLVEFLHDAVESVANVDGRVLRSVRTLVLRPGELTAAYARGVRAPYMRPFQLFFLVNVVFFFCASPVHMRVFDTPLRVHMGATWHRHVASRKVEGYLARTQRTASPLTLEQYATRFDQESSTQAKTLLVSMVPAFALMVALLQWRRRRPAAHHLAFAFHSYSAFLLVVVALAYVAGIPIEHIAQHYWPGADRHPQDEVLTLVIAASTVAYLTPALRRAYGDGTVSAVLKSGALVCAMGVILFGYRALLFFTTYWATTH